MRKAMRLVLCNTKNFVFRVQDSFAGKRGFRLAPSPSAASPACSRASSTRNVKRYSVLVMVVALVAAVCAGADFARAVGAAPNADIDESAVALNDMATVDGVKTSEQRKTNKSADDVVRELVDAYMEKHDIILGYNADKDKSFAMAARTVSVNMAHADFGKFRALAFDEAYGEALKDFVKSQTLHLTAQTASSFFEDTGTKAGQFEEELSSGKSATGALIDKLVALGDAITSDKLRKYGVDPDAYSAAPPDQKKVLMRESFRKIITERAAKSLSGAVPIQTFIGQDGNGNESVGVLVMFSPKLEAIAESLRFEKKPAIIAQGPPLKNILPLNDSEKLYDLLGVRVLFDENGVVIVSYGQWANSYSGTNASARSRHANSAFSQAESLANAQISEFLNTNFSSEDHTEAGKIFEESRVKRGKDNMIESEEITDLINIRKEVSKRKTSAHLRGASTLKRWTYTTPNGHEIVGVVKTYSFANMEAAKRQSEGDRKGEKPAGSGAPSGRTGQNQMDINTF